MDDFISWEEECALMDLVTASIVKRYNGPLERQCMGCQGDIFYTPVDLDQIRELLATLWGEFLKGDTLENALLIIDEEGCTDWPHGYEEEDAIKAAFDADWTAENVPPLTY